ncbi:hypothetical protein KCV87_31060 [Actinosynnema pretiosum subsp. pretiosum]|uniref:Suppressor of fused-like domain-containing protein n=1 Tax=Actinosynnema pretiosum subsp. pretiosum TaxID=103721 RepID=A0AA45L560_9PSEU|nr:hypothetical protein KCV87_31060 [Actinosynnema pretiosum subsp. pretiosum]
MIDDVEKQFQRYRNVLDDFLGTVSEVGKVTPRSTEDGPVRYLCYKDFPSVGLVTGFTYGLSLVDHPDWGAEKRELSITVRTDSVEWARTPAVIISGLRGIVPFNPGDALGYAGAYVQGFKMNCAVLAEPFFDVDDKVLNGRFKWGRGGDSPLRVVGVYPIHSVEREFVYKNGFSSFWGMEWDRLSLEREPLF